MLFVYSVFGREQLDENECWKMNTLTCLEIADQAWREKDHSVALIFSKKGCDLGDSYACGFHGYLLWENGKTFKALSYLRLACEEQEDRYCEMYQYVYRKLLNEH